MAEKDLLKRIRSIEKILGISYNPDGQEVGQEHLIKVGGRIKKLDDLPAQ